MKKSGYIIGIGAATIDICGQSSQPMAAGESASGSISILAGGAGRNICENAARMGVPMRLITVLGDDPWAASIEAQCAARGVDLTHALRVAGARSCAKLSICGQNGQRVAAVSELSLLERLTPAYLKTCEEAIGGAAAVVIDGGLPQPVVDFILSQWGPLLPVFVDPGSAADARKFARSLVGCHTIKPNRQEAQVLADMAIGDEGELALAAERILALGARRVVITLGQNGAYYARRGGERRMCPALTTQVVSAAGAGDCFTGALLYGFWAGLEDERLMKFAMTAAAISLGHPDAIHPNLQDELQKLGLMG